MDVIGGLFMVILCKFIPTERLLSSILSLLSCSVDSSVTSVLRIGQLGGTADDRGSFCSSGPASDAYLPLSIQQVCILRDISCYSWTL